METKQCKLASLLLWTTAAALLSQNMVVPVRSAATFEDQKNYYSPDQNSGTPPTGSHSPPSHGSGGHGSPTPSHGTHSHGGSSSYGDRPPVNCSNPPSGEHHHATQSPPRGGGGGYHHSPPTFTPSPPTTPSTLVSQ
ncbi:protodermal factor 1 [Forsythia ovata]|uniref:Protodermal factor 1 n=1 Tax=Forsythia ovata TaxID=205694 RepID=A0ABD1R4X9_9LAMI